MTIDRRDVARGLPLLALGPWLARAARAASDTKASPNAALPGVTRTLLQRIALPGTSQELRLELLVLAPGVVAPPHRHPVAGALYILEGAAESAYGDDARRIYRAGETLQDEAGRVHSWFRSADPITPLRFLVCYVIEAGRSYVTPV